MTAQPADLYERLRALRKDLTACQGKVTDALNILNQLNLSEQPTHSCPDCGLSFRGLTSMQEHRYNIHAGPLPDSYLAAERAAGLDEEPAA